MNTQLIYGDIGGTKTILQIAKITDNRILEQFTHYYESNSFTSFSAILRDFLEKAGIKKTSAHPVAACFAVAGPIVEQQVKLTNLPWSINAAEMMAEFSFPCVKLINDFEAAALAIEILSPNDLVTLQVGKARAKEMRVVVGAGTGTGVAWLTWQGDRYVPLSTEAGHVDFAPTSDLQIRLLEALQNKFGHVSIERLLSGSGLTNIFDFFQKELGSERLNLSGDSGAKIGALALQDNHPIAIKSLDLFAEIFGAYAGNLALSGLCRNGVYVTGGIAPKNIITLTAGGFMRAFNYKGRFSEMMNEIPVNIVTNPDICLLGAKQAAQYLLD